ncbi:unnamed protein product [Heligmosomoides polygyrus]|uniref:Helicase ATP-binding domain-containing protein n=1 Tax=Heligmosomoides polygyrus TaxID=6339 RepID=A0A183FM63_HELPZ|nr:unnamed protein product [Heligmosomoides polygyrus]
MICGRNRQITRVLTVAQIFKSYLHSSSNVASIGRYEKLQKRKDALASYPPEFRAKLKEWPKLLQAEIDEGVSHIKVRPSSSKKHLDGDTDYLLTMSQSSGALHSVQDFFLQNKVVDTPGVDLLGYAFRAKNIPSIHNDRMIAELPSVLNESQRRAVSAALNKRRPFVTIQGPPGTGKTRVVAEIVRQLYRRNLRTLVCAPSNVAVDKVMSEVIKLFGKDQEMKSDMIADAETMEDAITAHENYPKLCDIYDNMNNCTDDGNRARLRTDANRLKWKIIKESYKKRLVIFCTLTSSAIQRLSQVNWQPDLVIIDEAAQASEPVAWAAVVQAKRCILAGDHAQLPSTILSLEARKKNLDVSLMERLAKEFSNTNINQLLTVQYRMNEKIMQWSSREFYESRLVADESVAKITLSDISVVPPSSLLNTPLLMINTDMAKENECQKYREQPSQMSYKNLGEAELLIRYVKILKSIGIAGKDIAVISPYFAQVAAMRDMMGNTDVSVNTVDSFQGQEREVVVFSMVRHNPEKIIGFLQNERRLNVAITRAKRQFVLIGSARMMKKDRHLRSLLSTIQSCGKIFGTAMMETFEKGRIG